MGFFIVVTTLSVAEVNRHLSIKLNRQRLDYGSYNKALGYSDCWMLSSFIRIMDYAKILGRDDPCRVNS